jgi:hypothetical protein
MKYFKTTLLLFILTLLSCSSDDEDDVNNNENTNGDTTVLIKSITEKTYKGSSGGNDVVVELSYNYNGSKIISIEEKQTSDGQISTSKYEFTYTENLITSVHSISDYSNYVETISYDTNGRIVSMYDNYEYLSENEVISGDLECTRLLLSNNQINKIYTSNNCQDYKEYHTYEYDNKRNALSNIEGYNWAFMWDWTFSGNTEYSTSYNNLIKGLDYNYEYDYNENGYARNVSFFNYDGSLEGTMVIEYY